jgi:serine/threonine protein kinase
MDGKSKLEIDLEEKEKKNVMRFLKMLTERLNKINCKFLKIEDIEKEKELSIANNKVFLGKHKQDVVAIKEITINNVRKDVGGFERYLESMVKFQHERVPELFGVILQSSLVTIVMTFISNAKPLDEYCLKLNVDFKQRVEIFIQFASILRDLHEKNILHRNLKPLNVLVSELDKKVYLIGFRCPKTLIGSSSDTTDAKDTTMYMPLENQISLDDDEVPIEEEGDISAEENEIRKKLYLETIYQKELFKVSLEFDIWSFGVIMSQCISEGILPWSNIDYGKIDVKVMENGKIKKGKRVGDAEIRKFLNARVIEFPVVKSTAKMVSGRKIEGGDPIDEGIRKIMEKCVKLDKKERVKAHELLKLLKDYHCETFK